MSKQKYIPITTICTHYKVETTFIQGLNDYGLIEITTIEHAPCIHENTIKSLESMIRLHDDLHLNLEGIDTVFNLLDRIENLQSELKTVRSQLRLYE